MRCSRRVDTFLLKTVGALIVVNKYMDLHKLAFVLLIVGGLNWLLVGLLGWDISHYLGGMDSMASRTIYILVGLAALYELMTHRGVCKNCTPAQSA